MKEYFDKENTVVGCAVYNKESLNLYAFWIENDETKSSKAQLVSKLCYRKITADNEEYACRRCESCKNKQCRFFIQKNRHQTKLCT